ncbi:MAG: ABC transporter permease [Alphaproteobacteria bacterium]|nr:ABC transporter permease [Alphaproteobacteria bacterium]
MQRQAVTLLLLGPAVVILGVLFVLPLGYFLVISFWRVVLFKLKPDATLANYNQVFELHLSTLIFTLELALVVSLLTTTLGFIFAYLIRFKAGRWGPALLFIAMITLFGGYLMKIYSWMTILGITGVLNTALLALGLVAEPLPWLFYNEGAVVVTLVNFLLPITILPIYAAMRGVTNVELEAARDLGAGVWRAFSDILVPRCQAGIAAGFALSFLLASGDYLTPQLVGGKVNMIGVQIAAQFGGIFNWPMGAAMSFVTLACSLGVVAAAMALLALWRPR